MRHDPDVLVIGAGIAGLFCAYYLRRAGSSVVVLERGPVGGPLSCSSGNTGFVGTQGAAPLAQPGLTADDAFDLTGRPDHDLRLWLSHFRRACNERVAAEGFGLLLEMKKQSLQILRTLCGSGRLAGVFEATGMVLAFKTAQAFEKACQSVAHLVANGVPMRILSPEDLRRLEPDIEFDISGALYNADGAFLRVPGFVIEFARMLEEMGVEICTHAEAVGFEAVGGRVTHVRTTRGEFRPHEVVLAAGAWSAQCARGLGIGLALQPVKGYSVTVKTSHIPRLPILLSEGHVAVAPLGDRLRFAGTLELSGMNDSVPPERVAMVLRTVHSYLPRLECTETIEVWSGYRPCTPDSLPFLGRAEPYRNLSVACGHGHIGMGLAPVGGKLIAQLITAEPTDMDLKPFRLDRYPGSAR